MPDGSSLEYIVRPYQSPDAHGAVIIPSTPSGSRQTATLKWGTQCTIPEVSGENFQMVCCKEQSDEQDGRITERIKVYQNGDSTSDNWVELERAKKLTLKKTENNNCGDNWDDISGVAQQVDSTLADFESFFNKQTGNQPQNCNQLWTFKPPVPQPLGGP